MRGVFIRAATVAIGLARGKPTRRRDDGWCGSPAPPIRTPAGYAWPHELTVADRYAQRGRSLDQLQSFAFGGLADRAGEVDELAAAVDQPGDEHHGASRAQQALAREENEPEVPAEAEDEFVVGAGVGAGPDRREPGGRSGDEQVDAVALAARRIGQEAGVEAVDRSAARGAVVAGVGEVGSGNGGPPAVVVDAGGGAAGVHGLDHAGA